MSCDTCDMTLSCTPSYIVSPKEKKKKVNINNNLAVLPSHDKSPYIQNFDNLCTRTDHHMLPSIVI